MIDLEKVKSLFKDCILNTETYFSENEIPEIIDSIYSNSLSFSYNYGATKLCIFVDGFDYVLKIPFNSSFDYISGHKFFYLANYFDVTLDEWNYCEVERSYFQKSQKRKLDFAFLNNEVLCDVNNYPIYIQKKVSTYATSSVEWFEDFSKKYGAKKSHDLTNFLSNYNISDLHKYNLGYLENGDPVIFDYSGYMEIFA